MNKPAIDAIFVHEYRKDDASHCWGNIPDDLWWRVVSRLGSLGVNGIGFQNLSSKDSLLNHTTVWELVPVGFNAHYAPYHGESNPSINVFEFNTHVQHILLSKNFDQWNRANDAMPFDELVFFVDHKAKIQVVPYENLFLFYQLSEADILKLSAIDHRLVLGLYTKDMKRLVP